jgi:hypothetical protein
MTLYELHNLNGLVYILKWIILLRVYVKYYISAIVGAASY